MCQHRLEERAVDELTPGGLGAPTRLSLEVVHLDAAQEVVAQLRG